MQETEKTIRPGLVVLRSAGAATYPESITRLNLPAESGFKEAPIQLGWFENKLALFSSFGSPVYVEFSAGKADHRRKFGGGKNQLIAKAVGLAAAKKKLTILDATAGLGRDSFVLASLGCNVTMTERSPILAAMLEDGLNRGKDHREIKEIIERLSLFNGDVLKLLSTGRHFDVIYLDPMYPERKKSASVKKEMRLLQQLVGSDTDADSLLKPALECAVNRVVVKRPKGAPYLEGQNPNLSLSSAGTRFDIYTLSKIS